MASVDKIMCFIRSCNTCKDSVFHQLNKHVLVEALNFCLMQIWVKFAKVVVFYSAITKHGNFNTKIDSYPSVNYETPKNSCSS